MVVSFSIRGGQACLATALQCDKTALLRHGGDYVPSHHFPNFALQRPQRGMRNTVDCRLPGVGLHSLPLCSAVKGRFEHAYSSRTLRGATGIIGKPDIPIAGFPATSKSVGGHRPMSRGPALNSPSGVAGRTDRCACTHSRQILIPFVNFRHRVRPWCERGNNPPQ
jgi:hypothetical protein